MSHNLTVTAILQRIQVLLPPLLITVTIQWCVPDPSQSMVPHVKSVVGNGACNALCMDWWLMDFPPQRKSSGWKSVAPCSQTFQSFFSFKLHPILDFSGLMSEMTNCPLRSWLKGQCKTKKKKLKKKNLFKKCLNSSTFQFLALKTVGCQKIWVSEYRF